jgi:hypothetical protein
VAEVIKKHVLKCRENPFLAHAKAVILPESNMGTVAQELDRELKGAYRIENKLVMYEDNANKGGGGGIQHDMPGSVTTNRNKIDMVEMLIKYYMKPNKLFFYKDFISAHEGNVESIFNIRKEFVRELRVFSKIKEELPTGGCKVSYSGKRIDSDDDLVITLMLCIFMRRLFFSSDKYAGDRV